MNENEILEITSEIGKKLLMCGAEVYRVEESIIRICNTYGYENSEAFAIPRTIIITVYDNEKYPHTVSINVKNIETNLEKAGDYNNLCRKICRENLSFEIIKSEMKRIEEKKPYPFALKLLCSMVVGMSFVFYFGGDIKSGAVGGILGGVIFLLSYVIAKTGVQGFMNNFICAAAISFIATMLSRLGIISSPDTVIISVLMNLVPGVAITNCMRDFIGGDLLAGLYTMAESLTAAVSLAVGAGVIISAFG